MMIEQQGSALGEAFYWMAEKLAWGYEDIKPNISEAFKLFQQAADLGFPDALIRLGQLQESGKGIERDPNAALKSYAEAAKAHNYYALAFIAKLLARSSHLEKAEAIWRRFFVALAENPEPGFFAATRGELLHDYIATQLRLGLDPAHRDMLQLYRLEIAGHHQLTLEKADGTQIKRLERVSKWIELNLGPSV